MNIGIVADNELNNDKRILREAAILAENGHSIHALCFGYKGIKYRDIPGINVSRIIISRRIKNILFFFINMLPFYEYLWGVKIKHFIKKHNIEAIHAHDLYMSKAARSGIIKSRRKVKLILDLHENFAFSITTYNWTKGFLRSALTRPGLWSDKEFEYLSYANRYVVLSNEFADELVSKYPSLNRVNFYAVQNVPDVETMELFRTESKPVNLIKSAPVLFYFGVVAERRGIFDALAAFREVINRGINLEFLIIGPVDKKDLSAFKSEITSKDISSRVKWIRWIDLSELPSYLDYADICIAPFKKNPQHESGVANKIYDYMLGKKPVIVSDCRPQKRLVELYNCGISFSDNNQLVDALITLASNEPLRDTLGNNGYNAVIKDLNTKTITNVLIDLYSGINNELNAERV